MSSVLEQTQLASSRCRRPITLRSSARQAEASLISVINQEPMIFMGRFLNTTRTPCLTPQVCLALPRTIRRKTISEEQSGARSEKITLSSSSTTKAIASEALLSRAR